ncbi:MAG: TraR/DksA family transcriptional regulator [Desulfobacterales bacterium]|nr:TraR/DksA C4-type zinc finger protein [Deltaproteobacteria bacterium]NNK94396.1 TraR/DksA family transcriptional regulator [Desulfobacterales bacterium]
MNDRDRAMFKQLLISTQQELNETKKTSEKSTQTVALDQSSVGRLSRMDAMQSQAMALAGKRRREIQLTRIRAALERLDDGEYGYCAVCEGEIDQRRLRIDPANPFCINCAATM